MPGKLLNSERYKLGRKIVATGYSIKFYQGYNIRGGPAEWLSCLHTNKKCRDRIALLVCKCVENQMYAKLVYPPKNIYNDTTLGQLKMNDKR